MSNQGERLALSDAASNVIFEVTYDNKAPWPTAAAGLGSSLVLIDPFSPADNAGNWVASARLNGSPGVADAFFVRDIVINELLPHTDPPQEDAVEFRNLTTSSVSVAGWYLSDDNTVRKKYRFPAGTTIPPQGYLVVYQQQLTNAPVPFSLSSKGDDLYLSEADGTGEIVRYVDQYLYDASQNGVSFGRYPDGTGEFLTLAEPTFGVDDPSSVEEFRTGAGARNAGPKVGPVVINEIMYHPSVSNNPGRMPAEYVEILNISPSPVPLYNVDYPSYTWSLTGGIGYDFPTNLTLQPGEFLLIVGTNDVEGFRLSYGLSNSLVILGPWSNNLSNAGDTVRLRAPNSPELPDNTAARYVVDEVQYNDRLPWPLAADGLGGSLERNDSGAFGNTADNWHSLPGICTPGATNSIAVPPGSVVISEIMANNRSTLRDEDGDHSDWIEIYNTRSYDISLRNWHLTDTPGNLTLWTFPDMSIPAHGYVLVFASGKNRTNDLTRLHTNFGLSDNGEYLALVRDDLVIEYAFETGYPAQFADISYGIDSVGSLSAMPIQAGTTGRYLVPTNAEALSDSWFVRTFDDSAWRGATNGVGYDTETTYRSLISTDVKDEMLNKQGSLFLRLPFLVENSANVLQMSLRVKFDDGFAAYLNGTRVAATNAPATPAWNSLATALHDDAQALLFQNFDLDAQTHLLIEGTNVLALQELNSSTNSSDLLLLPELDLTWSAANGATGSVGYLLAPSPANANGTILPDVTPLPVLSNTGGVLSGNLSVTITCAGAGASIHYTLDGSTPTTNSPLYSSPILITNTTELLVRTFEPGMIPSPVVGALYRTAFLGINEFLANNVRATPEIADFTDFGDWIELYNDSTNTANLGGYYLSDNFKDPFCWRIPDGATVAPKGYFLVWADGLDSKPGLVLHRNFYPGAVFTTIAYHATFKLGNDGEQIGLFTASGSLVDGVTYGLQSADVSQGRFPDGSGVWRYFGECTPAGSNRAPALTQNNQFAPAVLFFPPGTSITNRMPVSLVLTTATPAVAIRYTLDGSTPSSTSALYTVALTLTTTTIVRARAYADGAHPGPIETHTFFVGERVPELQVLSIVTDPYLLYDSVRGIYTNVLKEREIPVHLEYGSTSSNNAFQFDCGLRIFGLNTYLYAQKPFTIYLDAKYGTDLLQYKLFDEKPVSTFDRLVLRNGCDDWTSAFFRDPLATELVRGCIDNELQGYRPVASYLNGKYFGILNIREKVDEMLFVRNNGANVTNMDYFEMDGAGTAADPILVAGTVDAWNALTAFVATNDLSIPANFEYVQSQVDLEDLMDFVIAEAYVANTAWFWNRKWWRDRSPGGRWRWTMFDNDRALVNGNTNHNTVLDFALNMEVFRELLGNQGFRQYFAQRFAAHINSTFRPGRVIDFLDQKASQIRSEMVQHIARWGSLGGIASTNAWESQLAEIRLFAQNRPAIVLQQLAQQFGSNATANVIVTVGTGTGQVLADYCPLVSGYTNTFLAGLPLQLKALPAIGQRFVRWDVNLGTETQTLLEAGSVWRYNDAVTNTIAGWTATNFNDSVWSSGAARLGYGGDGEVTTVGFGPDPANKYRSTYFRTTFVVTNLPAVTYLKADIIRDDGVVLYLNGQEVLRQNMPAGTIVYTTFASNTVGGADETNFFSDIFPAGNLVMGTNILAAEVHQCTSNSSDLGFDLRLSSCRVITQTVASAEWTVQPETISSIQAVFAPSGESLLPSTMTSNLLLTAADSPYLATGDIVVPSNKTLTAGPGVTIQMPDAASIYVYGQLQLLGSTNAPVCIVPNTNDNALQRFYVNPDLSDQNGLLARWGGIAFDNSDHPGLLSNVYIRGASLARADPVNFKGAINALQSDLLIDGLDMDDVQYPIFVQEGNSTILRNSRLHISVVGDIINIKRADYALVENNDFRGCDQPDTDAVDYDGVHGGIIRSNRIYDFTGFNCDGVDIGEIAQDLLIEGNRIWNCFDKGISIGQASTAIIRHNLIMHVDMGLGIKDRGSYGLIENNTFHKLSHAVSVYEKNLGDGGGAALVRNCIVSHATVSPFSCDSLSTITVSYCISDTDAVPGTSNLTDEVLFLNASATNFHLQVGSPAVDSGDPSSDPDPDGSRADMGAFAFDWREGHAVISEIHYHPADSNRAEFVELNNPGGAPLDLEGYCFSRGLDYVFPSGAILAPGAYLVVAAGTNVPGATNVLVWTFGILDNAGETIQLIDPQSNEIDRVAYGVEAPWPAAPNGLGPSLALIDPRWNNSLPASWYASEATGGTPDGPFDNHLPGNFVIDRVAGGGIRLSTDGLPGLLYLIEYSPTLLPPNWSPVGTAGSAMDGLVQIDQTPASGNTQGFYRVRAYAP